KQSTITVVATRDVTEIIVSHFRGAVQYCPANVFGVQADHATDGATKKKDITENARNLRILSPWVD
uniref:hypothetical protein n=1 Tax=unclassified Bradyrhizobium TaxID=2631580 RepID=UPI0028E6A67B